MSKRSLSRRSFLGEASCAAVGSASVLSTMLNLQMANHAAAAGGAGGSQRKTLVCLFLSGGWDSYNVLIPYDASASDEASDAVYTEYKNARSNLAIPRDQLRPLTGVTDASGRNFGLHPSCERLAEMFNGTGNYAGKKRLSALTNIGTLIEPITNKSEYINATKRLPKALFSHRDQIEQWQTSVPQGLDVLSGWGGRAADVLHSTFNTEQTGGFYMPMNFSLGGNSAFQTGVSEGQFVITANGALKLTSPASGNSNSTGVLAKKNAALSSILGTAMDEHYQNLLQQSFGSITRDSIERGATFQEEFDDPGTVNGINVQDTLDAAGFPNHYLANNLKAAVKNIAIRDQLKLCRQTVFIEWGGWDHHAELLNTQATMLDILDDALYAFQNSLETLGLQDDVITFSCSDFGRTLRSNGQGTDHAWAGNQFCFGGPVAGGQLHGTFPSLVIDGADDVGRGGRLFPRLSCDEYFCELLRWFGVSAADMDQVLPNITEFFDPNSASNPIGFLA